MMGNTVKSRVLIIHDGKYSQIALSLTQISRYPVEGTYNFSSNKSCACFVMANVAIYLYFEFTRIATYLSYR
jgi:hypothetical protein